MPLDKYPIIIYPDYIGEYLSRSKLQQRQKQPSSFYKPTSKIQSLDPSALSNIVRQWDRVLKLLVTLSSIVFVYQGFTIDLKTAVVLFSLNLFLFWGLNTLGKLLLNRAQTLLEKDLEKIEQSYWAENQLNNARLFEAMRKEQMRLFIQYQGKRRRWGTPKNASCHILGKIEHGKISKDAPKGVSEAFLNKYLQYYFSECQIHEEYYAIEGTNIGYTSDFSIIDPHCQIGIDLEVDEPYEGKTKKPHHCIDFKTDFKRNNFFKEKGWIIVRVSEYQVISQPESVCKLVAEIFAKLTGDLSYLLFFQDVDDLKSDPCWNSIQARNMVQRKYRERYLDEAGIYSYNPQLERENRAEYIKQQQEAKKAAKKRRRDWRKRLK